MSEKLPDAEWPEGGPVRPMTQEESELRAEWQETQQQQTLRVGALCCAAVVVRLPTGDEAIGTAFHIGEGVYLTARHVLENNELLSLIPYDRNWLFRDELTVEAGTGALLNGEIPIWNICHANPHVVRGPFFHEDERIDVAAFVANGIDPNTLSMALGFHYDDWISTASGAIQLAATVEVNGVVDTYRDRYVRFVVSGPPRGGFSGGPVYHSRGFVLGMVIESLEHLGRPEPGFFTVLSIEALHEVLEQHGLTPKCQAAPTPEESMEIARAEVAAREAARVERTAALGNRDQSPGTAGS